MAPETELTQRLGRILFKDTCYRGDAYIFVMGTIAKTVEQLPTPRHISGAELVAALRKNALEQFGPMAHAVFEHWGIKNSLDFGRIVFNMVDEGLLSKTETDTLEDFKDIAFFEHLFDSVSGYRLTL